MDEYSNNAYAEQAQAEQVGKTFTQADVDKIIGERLARERSRYSDYDDVKAVLAELNAYGYEGDARTVREIIRQQREAYQAQLEAEEAKKQAEEMGVNEALVAEIKRLQHEVNELSGERKAQKQAELQQAQIQQQYNSMVSEFNEKYPDISVDELKKDEEFMDFVEGMTIPLVKAYDKFLKFKGEAAKETMMKVKSKELRSTSSGKGASSDQGTYGLSTEQKKTVDQWNQRYPHMPMSYKEYSQRLKGE